MMNLTTGVIKIPNKKSYYYVSRKAVKTNTEILIRASREIGVNISEEKSKYMVMDRNEGSVGNEALTVDRMSFERVKKFKCLGALITGKNEIREELKKRINSGNAS